MSGDLENNNQVIELKINANQTFKIEKKKYDKSNVFSCDYIHCQTKRNHEKNTIKLQIYSFSSFHKKYIPLFIYS